MTSNISREISIEGSDVRQIERSHTPTRSKTDSSSHKTNNHNEKASKATDTDVPAKAAKDPTPDADSIASDLDQLSDNDILTAFDDNENENESEANNNKNNSNIVIDKEKENDNPNIQENVITPKNIQTIAMLVNDKDENEDDQEEEEEDAYVPNTRKKSDSYTETEEKTRDLNYGNSSNYNNYSNINNNNNNNNNSRTSNRQYISRRSTTGQSLMQPTTHTTHDDMDIPALTMSVSQHNIIQKNSKIIQAKHRRGKSDSLSISHSTESKSSKSHHGGKQSRLSQSISKSKSKSRSLKNDANTKNNNNNSNNNDDNKNGYEEKENISTLQNFNLNLAYRNIKYLGNNRNSMLKQYKRQQELQMFAKNASTAGTQNYSLTADFMTENSNTNNNTNSNYNNTDRHKNITGLSVASKHYQPSRHQSKHKYNSVHIVGTPSTTLQHSSKSTSNVDAIGSYSNTVTRSQISHLSASTPDMSSTSHTTQSLKKGRMSQTAERVRSLTAVLSTKITPQNSNSSNNNNNNNNNNHGSGHYISNYSNNNNNPHRAHFHQQQYSHSNNHSDHSNRHSSPSDSPESGSVSSSNKDVKVISLPMNVQHLIHVRWDEQSKAYTGIPDEWQSVIPQSKTVSTQELPFQFNHMNVPSMSAQSSSVNDEITRSSTLVGPLVNGRGTRARTGRHHRSNSLTNLFRRHSNSQNGASSHSFLNLGKVVSKPKAKTKTKTSKLETQKLKEKFEHGIYGLDFEDQIHDSIIMPPPGPRVFLGPRPNQNRNNNGNIGNSGDIFDYNNLSYNDGLDPNDEMTICEYLLNIGFTDIDNKKMTVGNIRQELYYKLGLRQKDPLISKMARAIQRQILSYCDVKSFLRACVTCSDLASFLDDPLIWKIHVLYKSKVQGTLHATFPMRHRGWKATYYTMAKVDRDVKYCDYVWNVVVTGDTKIGPERLVVSLGKHWRCRLTHIEPVIDAVNGTYRFGIDFVIRRVVMRGMVIKLQVWDGGSGNVMRDLGLLKSVNIFLILFDTTSEESFGSVKETTKRTITSIQRSGASKDVQLILVGNTTHEPNNRKISYENAKRFANERGLMYIEANTDNPESVNDAFVHLAAECINYTALKEATVAEAHTRHKGNCLVM